MTIFGIKFGKCGIVYDNFQMWEGFIGNERIVLIDRERYRFRWLMEYKGRKSSGKTLYHAAANLIFIPLDQAQEE